MYVVEQMAAAGLNFLPQVGGYIQAGSVGMLAGRALEVQGDVRPGVGRLDGGFDGWA